MDKCFVLPLGPVISGIYAPFIMGQVSTALTLTMLVVPLLVNWLTPDNTSEEWAMAFWLVALIIVLSNTFYLAIFHFSLFF